eukprot:snap_masked-scaffold_42-processed-gene-2.40-mRNA-1 protein AED:1.00 eAED:1.00 QI:0/-1/0/0/-1/1/1/0/64
MKYSFAATKTEEYIRGALKEVSERNIRSSIGEVVGFNKEELNPTFEKLVEHKITGRALCDLNKK